MKNPKPPSLAKCCHHQEAERATTHAIGTAAKRDMAQYTISPARTKMENPCLLFVTASVVQLNLGPGVNTAGRSTTVENAFQNPQMVATFSIPSRAGLLWRCYHKGARQIEDITNLL